MNELTAQFLLQSQAFAPLFDLTDTTLVARHEANELLLSALAFLARPGSTARDWLEASGADVPGDGKRAALEVFRHGLAAPAGAVSALSFADGTSGLVDALSGLQEQLTRMQQDIRELKRQRRDGPPTTGKHLPRSVAKLHRPGVKPLRTAPDVSFDKRSGAFVPHCKNAEYAKSGLKHWHADCPNGGPHSAHYCSAVTNTMTLKSLIRPNVSSGSKPASDRQISEKQLIS
ncbi:hypothetical protein CYMTET_54491 [Cymbomonas tetramitiformis]|uniref:Uncharacterized protein n=1 Tax=Cymbomonas tetramitiformis TaxID=36881 RepID=A0AAE0BG85_9CHLO|nr:hypothetical protein CYMTET_54491 [Cymbomonas tetramitiformis]